MKLKFKTNHLREMDFNSESIKMKFIKLRKENSEIIESQKVDYKKLIETVFTI